MGYLYLLPVISTAFVLNSGTSVEPFLRQVISRTIKIVVDTSGSQSASTSATFSSDIYSTVELTKMTYIRLVTWHSPIKTRIILLLLDQVV
jgi:hypothetical protein